MEYLPDAETLFTGVYELPPAHTLTWQAGWSRWPAMPRRGSGQSGAQSAGLGA